MSIQPPRRHLRGIYILPNLLTTASLFGGFLCMILAAAGQVETAAGAIFFSAVMDGLDGKIARLTHSSSQFGIEYDSLADLTAFGAAPAFLAWSWQLEVFHRLGIAVSFLFLVCAALRLARFNLNAGTVSKRFFIGLPSPAAGCSLAAFVLFSPLLPSFLQSSLPHITLGISFIVPILMISRVRYFSFKEFDYLRVHRFRSLVAVLLIFVLLFSMPRQFFFFGGLGYILSGLIYTFLLLPRRNRQILRHLAQS